MIKCPDCKNPISDSAECCPQCGSRKHKNVLRDIQRQKERIRDIENGQPPGKAASGGCVAVPTLIFSGLLFWLAFEAEWFWVAVIAFIVLVIGGICTVYVESKDEKVYNNSVSNYNEAKQSLPEERRRLAELESKIR